MNDSTALKLLFPPICPFEAKSIPHPLTYVVAAGFEERTMAFLDCFAREKIEIESALAIEYKPHGDPRNKVNELKGKLEAAGASIEWITYDRRNPQEFQSKFPNSIRSLGPSHVLVDTSALSKFLIMLLLQSLTKISNDVTIAYAEAEIYHPTKSEFEKEKRKLGVTPDFLTTGIYDILTVTSLSSVSMQGYPILLLAFPTFNHFEIGALYNELSPHHMILLEGDPHEKRDKWRLQGIIEVNRNFHNNPDYASESRVLSTFDYVSNILTLEEIYKAYYYSHKILLAPTGSKLQTVATFMFKQLHPDIQVVYPVTGPFKGEYSEKCRALWSIKLGRYADFIGSLNSFRMQRRTG